MMSENVAFFSRMVQQETHQRKTSGPVTMVHLADDVTDEQLDAILEKLAGGGGAKDNLAVASEARKPDGEWTAGGGSGSPTQAQVSSLSGDQAENLLLNMINSNNGNFGVMAMLGTQALSGFATPLPGHTKAVGKKGKSAKHAAKKAHKTAKGKGKGHHVALTVAQQEQKLIVQIHRLAATIEKAKNDAAEQKSLYTLNMDLHKLIKLEAKAPGKH